MPVPRRISFETKTSDEDLGINGSFNEVVVLGGGIINLPNLLSFYKVGSKVTLLQK